MTTCSDGSLVTEDTRDVGPAARDGVSDKTDSWTPVCSQRKKKRKDKRKKLQQTSQIKEKYCIFIYYMAHQSMIEIEHCDWILSGPYFAVRTAQMDHSRNALFCFGSLVMGFISLVNEIQFMLIGSRHILNRSMNLAYNIIK